MWRPAGLAGNTPLSENSEFILKISDFRIQRDSKLSTSYPQVIAIVHFLGYLSGMIRLETGSPSDYWPRISDMARDVAAEVMGDSSIDIDVGTYEAAYEAGMLITCFALDGDDVVGFSVAWVAHDPHDAGTTRATSDVIYVRPSHRNTAAGSMLINETELMAKDRGAMFMSWGAADGSTMQSLLFARGYKRSSLYTRQL